MNGTRKTTVVLAIVLGVLVAATGVFVTLYLIERSATAEVDGQVAVTERELAGARDRLSTVRSNMDKLADEERDLVDAGDALRACAEPTGDALRAGRTGDDPALAAAVDQMLLHCTR
ncbi:hypothetical protein [Actinophytocola sp. NPDC049390]|uniref:hypothetical protein n=1 Tax=Actinophytocola sp. NPDC049390 TaxID=3363894 RepID=UPI0037B419F9